MYTVGLYGFRSSPVAFSILQILLRGFFNSPIVFCSVILQRPSLLEGLGDLLQQENLGLQMPSRRIT